MSAHIVLLSLIVCNGILFYSKDYKIPYCSRRSNRLFVVFSEACIFLLVGLRSSAVGIDTIRYKDFFEKIARDSNYLKTLDWAFLFRVLVTVSEKFHSFQMLLLLCAAINCIGFGYFFLSATEDHESAFWCIFYFITLGSYFNSMNLMRQFCAMAVTVNIFTVLKKEQNRKSWIIAIALLLIGMCFHASAILSAVYFVPFLMKKVDKKTIIIFSGLALSFVVIYRYMIPLIFRFWDRYQKYAQDSRLTSGNIGVFAASMILLRIIMIILVLTMDERKSDNTDIYRQTIYTIVSTALFMLQGQTQFALRIGYYYEILFPVFIPAFIRKIKSKQMGRLLHVILALYAFTYFFYMMKWGGARSNRSTVPYTFFWQ